MCGTTILGFLAKVRTLNTKHVGRVLAIVVGVAAFFVSTQPSNGQFENSGCVALCGSGSGWSTGSSYFVSAPASAPPVEPVKPQRSAAERSYSDERDAEKETVLRELIPIKVGVNRHAVYMDDRGTGAGSILGTGGGLDFGDSPYSPLALVAEGN